MRAIECAECGQIVTDAYQQFAERLDYRRLDTKERRHSYTLRLVCRDCVDTIAQRHRARGTPFEQTELFS